MSVAALIPVSSAADLEKTQERERQERLQRQQSNPAIVGLSAHVRKRWEIARDSKRDLEERMLQCLRQRNGQYDPDIQRQIAVQGGSDIYVRLTSVKCRAATSWLRDTLMGSGADKPWAISATPEPDLPPEILENLQAEMAMKLQQIMAQGGMMPSEQELRQEAQLMQDRAYRELRDVAERRVDRMERKMEDQLSEGGWHKAFNEFLDDLVTFPYAVIKGPVKRKRRVMKWENGQLVPKEVVRNEWERVDPFMMYWAPWASKLDDGFVIERHKLTRTTLQSLMGVPGYNEDAIRAVLQNFSGINSSEWLWVDSSKAEAEDKHTYHALHTPDTIDALQLWDAVEGRLLREWGLSEEQVPDPDLSYHCEVWLVGSHVIRAVLNNDPLGRKNYYLASYEDKPGSVDGNGVTDLCRDSQNMVNSAARAMSNNMGLSSGPQVGVNVSRLAPGEQITEMFPWKIWQFEEAQYNTTQAPIDFFQPQSNAQELMGVFEKFSSRADEDTMIPKYMTGESTPGVGRTSSGLSMMISNAGKGIKQVIKNIDSNVIVPMIERLYQDNLRNNADDPDIIGDSQIVALGATSLVVKEADALRRNEFLGTVLNSPIAARVVGDSGTAELLRDSAKNLNMNVDKIVPDSGQMTIIEAQQMQINQLMQQLQMFQEALDASPDSIEFNRDEAGAVTGATRTKAPRAAMPDGSPAGGGDGNYMRNAATGRNG